MLNVSPAINTVPFLRDPDFVTRPELEAVEQKLTDPGARVALVGLGGVGYVCQVYDTR